MRKLKQHREDELILGLMMQFKGTTSLITFIKEAYQVPMNKIASELYCHSQAFQSLLNGFEKGEINFPLKYPLPFLLLLQSKEKETTDFEQFENLWCKKNEVAYGWFIDQLLVDILERNLKTLL